MIRSEELLHYIWKFRLYSHKDLKTTCGDKIEIIDPGMLNNNAGPDFFNAKIRIGDKMWAGDVEIHHSSDEWKKHKHHTNKAYNSVILHVTENASEEVFNEGGLKVAQFEMAIPEKIRSDAEFLLFNNNSLKCGSYIGNISRKLIRNYMDVLAIERLERKTNDIFKHLERFNNSWNDVLYVLLSRNFGFGLNSNEFERLAISLPYNFILKHGDNLFQVEALLFGQAGMLGDLTIDDKYYRELSTEYTFLRNKFSLKPLENAIFKSHRIRPQGFPYIRIAQLASLLVNFTNIFSELLDIDDYRRLRIQMKCDVSEYWQSHYCFGNESKSVSKHLSDRSLDIILINTVAPILFAYGQYNNLEKYCDKAIKLLETVKAESNSVITTFNTQGIFAENALETQSLIQLRREYCDKSKCLFCRIGHAILSKGNREYKYL